MSASSRILIGRLGEVWLKGQNRRIFLAKLQSNLRERIKGLTSSAQVQLHHDRFVIQLPEGSPWAEVLAATADTPGLTRVDEVHRVERDLDALKALSVQLMDRFHRPGTTPRFAVRARRSDKRFPMSSSQIALEVATAALEGRQLPVDLKNPELILHVELSRNGAFAWMRSADGVGGLPIGTAVKGLLLLSGGIDSPVAGYLAQNRGCELEAIYFHSPPFISEESREKVESLGRRLALRQGGMTLHVVHFTEIQKAIRAHCDGQHAVLLYRRFMYRIANEIAHRRRCKTLITGENVGQVASQTIENLTLVDRLPDRITMRPLLTFDKRQIMDLARQIGTYDTSILPHDDCCTLFVPKNPTIKGKVSVIEAQEARLDVEGLTAAASEHTEIVSL
ncbi:MAG: tRNA 4-thiouridine(8) synthase ThiI [Myxococcales bacterium]|nr:tRNA 4-thiouridine(8) synthase ThiI [Myxococcales bacterium]